MARPEDETARDAGGREPQARPKGVRLHLIGRHSFETRLLPSEGNLVIGRGETCDVRLDDAAVSRRHAVLHLGARISIEDAGSANGTKVRGLSLYGGESAPVTAGDPMEIGPWTLTLSFEEGEAPSARVWPVSYFRACLESDSAKARKAGTALDVVWVIAASDLDEGTIGRVLSADLRGDEIVAARAPGEYTLLLSDRTPEVVTSITRAITARLTELGVSGVRAGSVRVPAAVEQPQAFVESALEWAQRGSEPAESANKADADAGMARVRRLVDRVAPGTISVLLLGETGVGKEVTAEQIHQKSPRASKPFVRLNCASLVETLFESELFGYEKGAFTGALRPKPGLIETAEGGTLFLDEVGELPLAFQVKLLRVLEERRVLRLGALASKPIDVRVISATNKNLEKEIEAGRFRQDLYFRLNGITITIPPLRERKGEIIPLALSFIERTAGASGMKAPILSREAERALERYAWAGNIRELKNVVERAVLLSGGEEILEEHFTFESKAQDSSGAAGSEAADASKLADQMYDFERDRIMRALEQCNGNQTRAAKLLGISRRTLVYRLTEYRIDAKSTRSKPDE